MRASSKVVRSLPTKNIAKVLNCIPKSIAIRCTRTIAILFLISRALPATALLGPRTNAPASAPVPPAPPLFDDLDVASAELGGWLLADIARRRSELVALGWLARTYRFAAPAFGLFAPAVFRVEPYDYGGLGGDGGDALFRWHADGKSLECVVCESSVVARGVPIRLRLRMGSGSDGGEIRGAEVVAVGCDIAPTWPPGSVPVEAKEARAICSRIDRGGRRMIAGAVSRAIFKTLEPHLADVLGARTALVTSGDAVDFSPRHDLYAREGLNKKWLQRVSGYYFAESRIRDVRFDNGRDDDIRFTFYFDPTEPPNSERIGMNVNPEVLCCKFGSYHCN